MGIVIDTHAQLWTKEALATFPDFMLQTYREMFGDYLTPSIEETIEDMERAGVEQSVVVAIDAETTIGYKLPNEVIADAVSQYPTRLIGFAGVDPRKGKMAVSELRMAVEELGMRGVKIMPHLHDVRPNDPIMYPLYEVAQKLSVPVLFHSGTQYHRGTRLRCCRPADIDDVAVDFPDLSLIIAHFGWPWMGEALALAMRHPNVYINVAGWAPKRYPEELIKYLNGPVRKKALFGSDYPLVSRERIMRELRELPLKPGVLEDLTVNNPSRLLGVS